MVGFEAEDARCDAEEGGCQGLEVVKGLKLGLFRGY